MAWKTNPDGSAAYESDDKGGADASQAPGWGPIKITGTYTPDPTHPGDFWSHLGSMPPAVGMQGPDPMQGPGPEQAPAQGPEPQGGPSPELIQQLMQRQGGM